MSDSPIEQGVKEAIGNIDVETMPPVEDWLGTGSTLLDLAIADQIPGGVPVGRIVQVFGLEATAKTTMAEEVLGSAQRKGGTACYYDVEHTLDLDRAPLFGLNVDENFLYSAPDTIEDLFDIHLAALIKGIKSGEISTPVACVVDSLSALTSKAESEATLDKQGYGQTRARIISTAFRIWLKDLVEHKITLLLIDQSRTNLDTFAREKEVTSGGKAVKFYASVIVNFSNRGLIVVERDVGAKAAVKVPVGVNIGFKIVKNKISAPYRTGSFQMKFDYGIDDTSSMIEWLRENGDLGSGAWYDFGEFKSQGFDNAVKDVEEKGFQRKLIDMVVKKWRVLYQTTDRKERIRFY